MFHPFDQQQLLSIIPLAHVLLGQHNMQSKRLLQLQRGSPSRLPVRITIDPKTIHISSEDGLTVSESNYKLLLTLGSFCILSVMFLTHTLRDFLGLVLVYSPQREGEINSKNCSKQSATTPHEN